MNPFPFAPGEVCRVRPVKSLHDLVGKLQLRIQGVGSAPLDGQLEFIQSFEDVNSDVNYSFTKNQSMVVVSREFF